VGPGFLSVSLMLGERAKGGCRGTRPIAYGINNLVGGWGAAFCLTTTRLEGSSGTLYCLEQWLTHTFV
jgi:hypothetical protein